MDQGRGQASHPTTWWPWALMIAGDAVAVWRGYLAAWWYRQWLLDRALDPSGAELYYANAQVEAVYALAALAVAGGGVALLLRAQRRQRRALMQPDADGPASTTRL